MNNHQLRPLEVNPATGEPFLRLRKHSNVIITPPRLSDCPRIASLIGDPIIYEQLSGAPVPYLVEHAEAYMSRTKPQADAIFKALVDAEEQEELLVVDGCPVSYIREIQSDGSDLLIGHISIHTSESRSKEFRQGEGNKIIDGPSESEEVKKQERETEQTSTVVEWTIGDWLAPSHHGQGIMTDTVDTLIHDWAIPRMKVQRIAVGAFLGNPGSVRVFEKNGFRTRSIVEDALEVRGKRRGLHIMEWEVDQ